MGGGPLISTSPRRPAPEFSGSHRFPELPEFLRGGSFVGVDGAIDADDATAQELLAPLRALSPEIDTFARMPASELSTIHLDPPTPVPAVGDGFILNELDASTIDALLGSAAGTADSPLLLVDLRHLGGAVGRCSSGAGVVSHVAGGYLVYAAGIAPIPEAASAVLEAVASVRESLEPQMSELDYSNFREIDTAPERFWRSEDLGRLRAIKASVDPDDLIRSAHPLYAATEASRPEEGA